MSGGLLFDLVLVASVLAVATCAVALRRSFDAVVAFVAYGLLLALAWVRLGSVDVAMTEAAVGAGVSGVLLVGAAARLPGREAVPPAERTGPVLRGVLAALSALVALALGVAVLAWPDPAPGLAEPAAEHLAATGLGNPVTAVLLAYRALDTLLETVVLPLAVVGVWSVGRDRGWGGMPGPRVASAPDGPLPLLARLLPPIGLVVGVHVVWTGANAPGGAFQGGAVLAAMWLLAWMAGLARPPPARSAWLRWSVAVGPAAFLAIGLAGLVLAGDVLAYPKGLAKPLMVAIELALTWTIAVALVLLVVGPSEAAP